MGRGESDFLVLVEEAWEAVVVVDVCEAVLSVTEMEDIVDSASDD